MPNNQVPSDAALQTERRPLSSEPELLLRLTVLEADLEVVWGTEDPKEQADVLAKLSAWTQDERTKIESL